MTTNVEFAVVIESGDDAMVRDPIGELNTILFNLAGEISSGKTEGVIYDTNGNKAGKWSLQVPDDFNGGRCGDDDCEICV